jgi:hypothetical protein
MSALASTWRAFCSRDRPAKIACIGLNERDHADECSIVLPAARSPRGPSRPTTGRHRGRSSCASSTATGAVVLFGETRTARLRRTILELTEWLTRDNPVPAGTVLLTGMGLVSDGLAVAGGQTVEISKEGMVTLANPVAPR